MPAGAGGVTMDAPIGTGMGAFTFGGVNGQWYYGIPGQNWGGPLIDLSLGFGELPVFTASTGIPWLDEQIAILQATPISEDVDRRDQPPTEEILQETILEVAIDWFQYHRTKLADGTPTMLPPGSAATVVATVEPAQIINSEDDTSMGWLSDIYDQVDATVFGGLLPGGVDPGVGFPGGVVGTVLNSQGAMPTGVVLNQTTPVVANTPVQTLPVPGGVVMSNNCDNDPMRGMVYKKVCGQFKWVKQKRRRRKSLATQGDLKSLAALKGVLGNGKAFEIWIATHS